MVISLQMAGLAVGTESRTELAAILGQTVDYLNWLKDEGLTHVELSRTTGACKQDLSKEPPVPAAKPSPRLKALAAEIAACTNCGLHKTRTKTVPGQGTPHPEIMFVGEAPGADEDAQGLAFVGAAGQLLTKMIEAMGLRREEVFIANILKCRPDNRRPTPEEMQTCIPYLKEQIKVLRPRVIVALGATAVHGLLAVETGITKLRGQWSTFEGIDVMPTFHPAYLLRNPATKREAWDDLKSVLRHIGRTPPVVKKQA
jgi:DNA polymerase